MKKPKVSIILPVYKDDECIEKCLTSILNQSMQDIEILCMHNSFMYKTLNLIKKYKEYDNRVKIIEKNSSGFFASCNTGIDYSSGDYISIINPKDFVSRYMYETIYIFAKTFDADVAESPFFEYEKQEENIKVVRNWEKSDVVIPQNPFHIEMCPSFLYFKPYVQASLYKKVFLSNNQIKFSQVQGTGLCANLFRIKALCHAKSIVWCPEANYFKKCNKSEFINIC